MIDNDKTKILDMRDYIVKPKNKNKNYCKKIFYRILPGIFIPILSLLTIISTHSKKLVIEPISYVIYILLSLFIFLLFIGTFNYKDKFKGMKNIFIKIVLTIYITGCLSFSFLLYGPYKDFRAWLISTSMATMNHQYLCKWFYSDNEISKTLKKNYIIEVNESTDTSLIEFDKNETYSNEYERQVLQRDKNHEYKIIDLEINGQKAYLAIIYDPSNVKVGITSALGRYGQYATKMAKDSNAILAVNGGGFYDPGNNSTGGSPTGITISNNKIITDNNYSSYTQSGGVIGFTNDNVLILMKNTTATKALNSGVRDAISWGPFLIINGKKSFVKGNGGWGYAARTAIGQRSDGIVLLLVVDSNVTRTKGASMADLTEIMSNYGAVNAANLDGGTSSVMVLPKEKARKYKNSCVDDYCYINDPIDSTLSHKTRGIATTIIVSK